MATRRSSKDAASGRFRLDGGDEIEQRPALAVHALDAGGEVLATEKVGDDGSFRLDDAVVAKARRVVLTAADGDPTSKESAVTFRASTFRELVRVGDIAIGERDWSRLLFTTHCIDATIRRCFPFFHTIQDLVSVAKVQLRSLGPVISLPPRFRCAPICVGRVTVYRRRCCCPPIIIDPPILVEIPEFEPPIVIGPGFPDPPPDPIGPFPGPGPDPAPFALQSRVLTGGALDIVKLNAASDRLALKTLAGEALERYLLPRPYLWCHCGPPTQVAEGFVGEDGRIHLCWREPLRFIPRHCHDEYAFVVQQNIGGSTVTIYDGPAAGQWFDDDDDDIRLVSYHPQAVGCREDEFPIDPGSPFVVLQDLGTTESHHLATPLPEDHDSTFDAGPNSGLLEVNGISYALGGSVALRYHFSESMQGVGARYFRVQWAPANVFGDPVGVWETLPVPAWKTWRVDGGIVPGSHALGPNAAGSHTDLYYIPYETGVPLVNEDDEEWQDGQFHAYVPTDSKVEGRYLIRIEVFNDVGVRLEPVAAGFTYQRWDTPTTVLPVTFAAMTHLIRTDNRPVVAQIPDITGPGTSAGNCKFFVGHGNEQVVLHYRAYHPQAGLPSFMLNYDLQITRGISGVLATPALESTTEVGESGSPATHSVLISDLLDGEDKCSFAATLRVRAKIHNGSNQLSYLNASHISAFAVELA